MILLATPFSRLITTGIEEILRTHRRFRTHRRKCVGNKKELFIWVLYLNFKKQNKKSKLSTCSKKVIMSDDEEEDWLLHIHIDTHTHTHTHTLI